MLKYILLFILSLQLVLGSLEIGFNSTDIGKIDLRQMPRADFCYLGMNNTFTGNNIFMGNDTFYNATYLNEQATYINTTYNISSLNYNTTNILGSDLNGSTGETMRAYSINMDIVSIDNAMLQPTIDYNYTGGIVTFFNPVWNDQHISFWDTQVSITYSSFIGDDANGINGATGRFITVSNAQLVVVDNQLLHPNIDYTISGTGITFVNALWDDQKITVWHY